MALIYLSAVFLAFVSVIAISSGAKYTQMPYGFSGCKRSFGPLRSGISEKEMAALANAAGAYGYTYHPTLKCRMDSTAAKLHLALYVVEFEKEIAASANAAGADGPAELNTDDCSFPLLPVLKNSTLETAVRLAIRVDRLRRNSYPQRRVKTCAVVDHGCEISQSPTHLKRLRIAIVPPLASFWKRAVLKGNLLSSTLGGQSRNFRQTDSAPDDGANNARVAASSSASG
eukprot:IDg14287t1